MLSRSRQDQPKAAHIGLMILATLALLGATIACSFTFPFSTTQKTVIPTPKAPLGLIAYIGNDGNIYTIDRNGKQTHAITRDAALRPSAGGNGRIYQYLTWSPDGQHLAFVRISVSQPGQEVSLLSTMSDGQNLVNHFTSQDFQPFYLSWSPNSQTIAFLGSDATTGALSQYLVAASSGESKFISSGQPYYWDWSPDNRTMIVHIGGARSDNPDARLAFIGVDGSAPIKNLDLKPGVFEAPAWSSTGDGLVLATQNETGENELVIAGQDGKVKQVLAHLGGPVTFAWSPKGTHLAYAVYDPAGSTPTVHLAILDSTHPDNPKQVVQGAVVAFFWSPDGQKIAYFLLAGRGPSASSASTIAQTNPSSALDAWMYDRVSGTTKKIITFTPTDSFQQIFPFYSQYQRSDTIWSPDSQNLVLSIVDSAGKNAIYTVGVDGSQLQRIAEGTLAFWAWK